MEENGGRYILAIKFNNGFIIQYGGFAGSSGSDTMTNTIYYPITFNIVGQVCLSLSGGGDIYDLEAPTNQTCFTYRVSDSKSGNVHNGCRWISVGC